MDSASQLARAAESRISALIDEAWDPATDPDAIASRLRSRPLPHAWEGAEDCGALSGAAMRLRALRALRALRIQIQEEHDD